MGSNEKTFAILMLCGIVGIIFAIILQLLYDQSIIVDTFVDDTLTLRELQLGAIIIWELVGIGVAAFEQ